MQLPDQYPEYYLAAGYNRLKMIGIDAADARWAEKARPFVYVKEFGDHKHLFFYGPHGIKWSVQSPDVLKFGSQSTLYVLKEDITITTLIQHHISENVVKWLMEQYHSKRPVRIKQQSVDTFYFYQPETYQPWYLNAEHVMPWPHEDIADPLPIPPDEMWYKH